MNEVKTLIEKQSIAAERAGFEREELLVTASGAVQAFRKEQPGKPLVYVSSGVHGDEPAGPQAILELLEESFFDDKASWLICPALNPDGLAAKKRETGAGVDLNRDYLQCESQEAFAHSMWLKVQDVPDVFVSLHEDWESSGIYMYEINTSGEESKACELLKAAQPYFEIEPEMVIDDHEVTEPGWIFHPAVPDIPEGWPEAIFLSDLGCPLSYTFETPSSADFWKRVDCHKALVKRAVELTLGMD